MRKARFTEEHMVAIIRAVNRPHVGGGEAARGQRTNDLQLAQALRRLLSGDRCAEAGDVALLAT
jgi:hypothetical protein